jgi:hypothetical protein
MPQCTLAASSRRQPRPLLTGILCWHTAAVNRQAGQCVREHMICPLPRAHEMSAFAGAAGRAKREGDSCMLYAAGAMERAMISCTRRARPRSRARRRSPCPPCATVATSAPRTIWVKPLMNVFSRRAISGSVASILLRIGRPDYTGRPERSKSPSCSCSWSSSRSVRSPSRGPGTASAHLQRQLVFGPPWRLRH